MSKKSVLWRWGSAPQSMGAGERAIVPAVWLGVRLCTSTTTQALDVWQTATAAAGAKLLFQPCQHHDVKIAGETNKRPQEREASVNIRLSDKLDLTSLSVCFCTDKIS